MWTRAGRAVAARATNATTATTATTTAARPHTNKEARRAAHAAASHQHQHGPSCSHGLAAAAATATPASPVIHGNEARSGAAAPRGARALPPVLAPGEMPPGDHPQLPGWYQRPLPHGLIPFSSNRGKAVFKEAMNKGGMEGYFALAEQFQTQSTPAYCGPGTLAMVLNALALDPKRLWKGNWRWFSEEMLETCDIRKPSDAPLAGVDVHGLSFEEFLFLAECNGSHVRAFRSNESSLGKFRAAIATATTRTDLHVVASFSRKVLGQTGSGHYSPIGGYHAELDLALVLDVARFKYPPYWAPVPLLWKAICDVDKETGRGRGYYLMSKGKLAAQVPSATDATIFTPLSSACRIAVDKKSWSRLAEHFCSVLPTMLQQMHGEGRFDPATLVAADAASSANPTATATPASPSVLLDLQMSAIFREILLSLPVELSSIFIMYTHDLNERMVARYQEQELGQADAAVTTATSSTECTSSASCQVHASPLSIYHTLLPKHTPHQHSHSVPSAHALQPLLRSIASTRMFGVLQHANIDFAALESKAHAQHANDSSRAFHLLAGSLEGELELATLLLFACPDQIFSRLPAALQSHISSLRVSTQLSAPLQLEVRNLRAQMGILSEFCLCGAAPSVQGNDNPNVDPEDVKENESRHGPANESHVRAPTTTRSVAAAASTVVTRPRGASTTVVSHRFVSVSRGLKPRPTTAA